MKDERGSWYLVTGLVIGIILGVIYTHIFQPAEYVDTTPASLTKQYKDIYRGLIATAYTYNSDLVRASARLELLKDEDIYYVMAEQAQRMLADGSSPIEAQALGLLALDLGQNSSQIDEKSGSQNNSTLPTLDRQGDGTLESGETDNNLQSTVDPVGTPITNRPNPPDKDISFELVSRKKVCDLAYDQPMVHIQILDSEAQAVSGVEIIVFWENGEERYYTGEKPDMGLGYTEFAHSPDGIYFLKIGSDGDSALDFSAAECIDNGGNHYWGVWSFDFQQTSPN